MTTPMTPARTRAPRFATLRRFVAYSILAHLGAGAIWGLPALIERHAEAARKAEEQRLAEHFRIEEKKTAQHRRDARMAKTRAEVQNELRKDLGRLVEALPEKRRNELWTAVEGRTQRSAIEFAAALENPGTPEQDLKNLEADLRRAEVAELDHELAEAGARELADHFIAKVENEVAPDLGKWLHDQVEAKVADAMRDEAAKQLAGAKPADAAEVKGALAEAAGADLRAGVEQALAEQLANDTLPRIGEKMKGEFAAELKDAGFHDDALVAEVGKEIEKRLAAEAAALAKAGDQEQAEVGKAVGAQDGANTGGGKTAAGSPETAAAGAANGANTGAGHSAAGASAKSSGGKSANEANGGNAPGSSSSSSSSSQGGSSASRSAAASAAVAAVAARGAAGMKQAGGDASVDERLVAKAKGGKSGGQGEAAALADVHDRVAAMAKSGKAGNAGDSAGMAAVRRGAISRGAASSGGAVPGHGPSSGSRDGGYGGRDDQGYQEISGKIAGRGKVQGTDLSVRGANGETSRAEDAGDGGRPAQVVGPALAEATTALAKSEPYKPTFKSIVFAAVPKVAGDFRIDGDLAKWKDIPAVPLTPEGGKDTSAQTMRMAWSPAGLFLLFTIADPDHQMSTSEAGNFWESDCAEVWIDAYNAKEKFRARHAGQQFWLWPVGSRSDASATGGESVVTDKANGAYTPVALHADRLERWGQKTAEGWVMEARLPAATIADADLVPGRILGFNAYVTTMAGTNWFWSAGKAVATQWQPDTWGDLLLSGSDGRLEIIDAKGQASAAGEASARRAAVAGEPLRLRVTDADMNLDPAVADKVMVTLKDSHGGQQIAILEETRPDSGVFEGAVSTALALDEPIPGVLGVYEGEAIEAVYIDQARANGARDAESRVTVTFGATVTARAGGIKRAP